MSGEYRQPVGVQIGHLMNDPLGNQAERDRKQYEQRKYQGMSESEKLFEKAREKLAKDLVAAMSALISHDADREKLPPQYYREERARLLLAVRGADAAAIGAVTDYQIEAMGEARRLRSAAEAQIDPARFMAEHQEARALADGELNTEVLLEKAGTMLADEQPGRAAVYVAAIRARGGRAPLGLQELAQGVEQALDQTDPQRKAAAEIERSIGQSLSRFRQARLVALRDGGVGIASDGSVGTGASGQVASASVAEKMEAFLGGKTEAELNDLAAAAEPPGI